MTHKNPPAGGSLDLVRFDYRNHKGNVSSRRCRPIRIYFGCTAFHPEAQWLMEGFDLDKQQTRDYAMSGMVGPWQYLEAAQCAGG